MFDFFDLNGDGKTSLSEEFFGIMVINSIVNSPKKQQEPKNSDSDEQCDCTEK